MRYKHEHIIYVNLTRQLLQVLVLLMLTQRLGREMAPLLPMLHAVVLKMKSWTALSIPHMDVFMKMIWHSGVQLPVQVT